MAAYQKTFQVRTTAHNEVIDVTAEVKRAVADSGVRQGICAVYTPHATAAVTINENDDPNIGADFLQALRKMVIEHGGWLHDRVDNNAAAHIKSALIGPSESIPVAEGGLVLGTWQNVFLVEFDGPRAARRVIVTIVG